MNKSIKKHMSLFFSAALISTAAFAYDMSDVVVDTQLDQTDLHANLLSSADYMPAELLGWL